MPRRRAGAHGRGGADGGPGVDVVVVGGGNAALVAAITAREGNRRVLMLERAAPEMRGGNTRHTRNLRCVHERGDAFNTGAYLFEEFWQDLCAVGSGPSDEELASLTVRESESLPGWMADHGIFWQKPLSGTLHLSRTNRFFLGGGKALLNRYYRTAAALGVEVAYGCRVEDLETDGDVCTAVVLERGGRQERIVPGAVICAAGGYEANFEWLRRYWGPAADNYLIRGAADNDGRVLAALYGRGAAAAGEERGFHAVAIDARSPRYDGGIATRIDAIPFGIVVNRHGERFADEGEDLWPKRYASWGAKIALQDDQIAYAVWDEKVSRQFLPPMYGPFRAEDPTGLGAALGLPPGTLEATVAGFNAAVVDGAAFDPTRLDGRHTAGLEPKKSNWAQRLDTPPYYGIPLRPGITFTYMGVAVDAAARVRRTDGNAFSNVFAAGEIMSGNILSSGYLAGFGLTIGSVWGRIAGRSALACLS